MMMVPFQEGTTKMWKIDNASFEQLVAGKKKVEVKIVTSDTKEIFEKDMIIFFGHDGHKFMVVRRAKFKDFEDLLNLEKPEDIYPGKDRNGVLTELRSKFPRAKEKFGVYAFELTPYEPERMIVPKIIRHA